MTDESMTAGLVVDVQYVFVKSLSDQTLDEIVFLLYFKAKNSEDGRHDTTGLS